MSSTYIQLERTLFGGSVNQNEPVLFDRVVADSNDMTYDNGVITFLKTGTYFANWFVAQQTGLSTNGGNFAIVRSTGDKIAAGSHHKVAPTSGFGIFTVESIGETIELWNTANASAAFSEATDIAAGISVFLIEGGVPGPTGATGADGPMGPTGADGAAGADGATGATGADGAIGPAGPTGADGAIGPTGPTGNDGATGADGVVGSTGPTGPTGPSGPSDLDGVHVQTTNTILVQPDEAIIFDNVLNVCKTTGKIDYDSANGSFTIGQAGIYYVSWQAPVDGTESASFVSFSVAIDDVPHSTSRLPITIGMLSGSAIINATGSEEIKLINTTNDIVSVTPNANLVIIQADGIA